MADKQSVPKDPIQTKSLSLPIFLASVVLMGSVVLAGYDEFFGRRPYKGIQKDFVTVYLNHLEVLQPQQEKKLEKLQSSREYKSLAEERDAEIEVMNAAVEPVAVELAELQTNIGSLQAAFKNSRAQLGAHRYSLETARSDSRRDEIRAEMAEVKAEKLPVTLIEGEDEVDVTLTFDEISAKLLVLNKRKSQLDAQRGQLSARSGALQKEIDSYITKNMVGPLPANVAKLHEKTSKGLLGSEGKGVNDILQIHIGEFDWVDRCESCHAGTREPVSMRDWDINFATPGDEPVENAHVFTTHPHTGLLDIHNPTKFGCSMCHNGNGRSVTSEHLAHGMNHHWLFPLTERNPVDVEKGMGSFEAGCVQCHKSDLYLGYTPSPFVEKDEAGHAVKDDKGNMVEHDRASAFNTARQLFQHNGCWGCHRYEGIDTQPEDIVQIDSELLGLVGKVDRLDLAQDSARDPNTKRRINMDLAAIDTRRNELVAKRADLEKERQKVGPDLRYIKKKVRPDWLLPWLLNPKEFRPSTKMPQFFLNLSEDKAREHAMKIAAYLWQQNPAEDKVIGTYARGDAKKGEVAFKSRGCLGCHAIEDNGEIVGDAFAANLSHVGDKVEYDYLVKWIMEPDNGVMPNLRLSEEDSRNVATYLKGRTGSGVSYEVVDKLDDKDFALEGKKLISHYGCAGCHTINQFENEGRIGVELTKEGSKPKERLDFGRLEHGFKRAHRYTHKAFFEEKLRNPGVFGKGKVYEDPEQLDRLKMPNFGLDETQIVALSTLLLGSVESEIPDAFKYNPDERGQAIQKGWWVIKKYNCIGCHQIEPSVNPSVWDLPYDQYQLTDKSGKKKTDMRPPSLVGIGFRTNPKWLAEFLRNPTQTHEPLYGNGLRGYLQIRMPTFRMSEGEIQTIVKFFGALDSQSTPYVAPDLAPLTAKEKVMAGNVFREVNCNSCHAIGDEERDAKIGVFAPNLVWAGRKLRSDWTTRWLANPLKLLPGTNMPSNFSEEWMITKTDGTVVMGTEMVIRRGFANIKDYATNSNLKVPVGEIAESKMTRYVASSITGDLKTYKGDHLKLMMRYLHMGYDDEEARKVTPDLMK
ncbi:MAG: cytochrome c551/c552 [Planctomycetota bacterium]|jgi:cytochrome c551/c552